MKLAIVILACLLVLASAQSKKPTEPSDFSASVVYHETARGHQRRYHGHLYEDFSNKKQKLVVERHPSYGGTIDLFRFFDQNEEYEYIEVTKTCKNQAINFTMHAAFDWLENAHEEGACHGRIGSDRSVKGTQWAERGSEKFKREICVANNSTQTPMWVEIHHGNHIRVIEFVQFQSGAPDSSVFDLPSGCKKQ
eukprot:TRINITY_DN295_c0_g1_i1.p1 TRINITY_DN295_c0_g1~~TRINITY_DN295_c0_g1_i1.p1  ORF type:complete len:194 (-),score=48.71 TRINITY_DN295_c0_g1_i1:25-606(-)